MPDYQELYYKLFRASEEAINILIAAQRECEKLYISSAEPEIRVISQISEKEKSKNEE